MTCAPTAVLKLTCIHFHRIIMTLCKYCSNIPAKLFSFRRDDQCSYDHHPSLDALQGSAKQGCRGCQLFLHAVESSASDHAGRYKLSGEFRKWTNDEPVRLCSSKFGWQEVRINWTKSGLFRTFAVPSEWSMHSLKGVDNIIAKIL